MVTKNNLLNRVGALEKRINQIAPANGNTIRLNWRALYKWLESEVEEVIYHPNASPFIKDWAERLKREADKKLKERP